MKFSITFAFLAVAVTVKALATRPNIALEHNKAVGRLVKRIGECDGPIKCCATLAKAKDLDLLAAKYLDPDLEVGAACTQFPQDFCPAMFHRACCTGEELEGYITTDCTALD